MCQRRPGRALLPSAWHSPYHPPMVPRTSSLKTCSIIIAVFICFGLSLVPSQTNAHGAIATPSPAVPLYNVQYVSPNSDILPVAARNAIASALNAWPDSPPENHTFYLIDLRWETTWALATLTSANLGAPLMEGQDSHLNLGNLFSLLLVRTPNGWKAAIDSDRNVQDLLALVPESQLSQPARAAIFPSTLSPHQFQIQAQAYNGYKFPWPTDHYWQVTKPWHDPALFGFPANDSLDFDVLGATNSDILASASGVVTHRCTDVNNVLLVVRTDGTNEPIGYLHLDPDTVSLQEGYHVNQGAKLGRLKEGFFRLATHGCGYSDRTHLHMYFPTKPFTIDGLTFTDGNYHWAENLRSTQGVSLATLTLLLGSLLKNRSVTIQLRRASGFGDLLGPIFLGSARTDANGTIANLALNGVAPDTYNLYIKPHGYVQKKLASITIGPAANTLDQSTLFYSTCNSRTHGCAGDINDDNKVNTVDIGILISDYRTSSERSDLNADGLVNAVDIAMLIDGYFSYGDRASSFPYSGAGMSAATAASGQLALAESSGLAQTRTGAIHTSASQVGDVFTLTLSYDTGAQFMQSADVLVDYDHCALKLLDQQILKSSVFPTTNMMTRTATLEYEVDKWNGINPSSPVSGTGYLIKIPFQVIAGVSEPTNVTIRFRGATDTADSNMNKDGLNQEFLGGVSNFAVSLSGVPQRPLRSAQVISPIRGEVINQDGVFLQAQALDPCGEIEKVTFYAFYGGLWHQVGVDIDSSNGWSIYWDTTSVPDQIVEVKAFASDMAGNGDETAINNSIVLDRTPPALSDFQFSPVTARPDQPVTIAIQASDNLSGVARIDVYVDPSIDSTTPWSSWNLLGTVAGTSGSLVWNTAGYSAGPHELVLLLEDMAGNRAFWPAPGNPAQMYFLYSQQIVLPLISR